MKYICIKTNTQTNKITTVTTIRTMFSRISNKLEKVASVSEKLFFLVKNLNVNILKLHKLENFLKKKLSTVENYIPLNENK